MADQMFAATKKTKEGKKLKNFIQLEDEINKLFNKKSTTKKKNLQQQYIIIQDNMNKQMKKIGEVPREGEKG